MRVEDVYSPRTVHIPLTCTLHDAAIQMRDQHVGALVVTEPGESNRIVGIVTDRDIVVRAIASGNGAPDTPVAMAMTAGNVAAIDTTADIADAMQMMLTHGVRRLAVIGGLGEIAGVLSIDDVIESFARDSTMLAGVLRCEQNRERSGSVQVPLHM